jgi:hypothetical protein
MDHLTGRPGAPKGETATNRADRIRITMPRESRRTEYRPNRAGAGETPANRLDRLRETDVRGMSLKYYVERKTDRF